MVTLVLKKDLLVERSAPWAHVSTVVIFCSLISLVLYDFLLNWRRYFVLLSYKLFEYSYHYDWESIGPVLLVETGAFDASEAA